MSIYLLSTIIFVVTSFISCLFVYKRYKNTSAEFYILFSVSMSLWFLLYLVSFDSSYGADFVLKIYRFQYSLSMIGLYSILFFVLFFGKLKQHTKNMRIQIYAYFLTFFLLANFTGSIVEMVEYNEEIESYVEVFGSMYMMIVALYFFLIPAFLGVSFCKLQTLNTLNKIRLKYIILGYSIFLILVLSFLVFIPFLLGNPSRLYFEEFVPVYTLPFVFAVLYSSYRYKFFDIYVSFGKILLFSISLLISLSVIFLVKFYFFTLHTSITEFWGISWHLNIVDFASGVVLYLFFYTLIGSRIQGNTSLSKFSLQLDSFKEKVPFFSTVDSLNYFLRESFKNELQIHFFEFHIFTEQEIQGSELVSFFNKSIYKDVFINDIVFIEENKNKFDKHKIFGEISEDTLLIYPLLSNQMDTIGVVKIGRKKFNDYYSLEEIQILRNFVNYLQGHVKYISIYSQIHDLNVNLDKKVDEKTIEYNNLVNRQKEFIAFVSHEIKNPVTNALFLCDGVIENLEKSQKSENILFELREDASLLNSELIKIGELTKKIFSIEKYDLGKIKLFKEYTNLYDFLQEEIQMFEKKYPHVNFIADIHNVGNCEVDRIQLRQVLHNLIENAVKFTRSQESKVHISLLGEVGEEIKFIIEDNGEGFTGIDISTLFDKYSTGDSSSTGLGMGLYLCKRIVELHGWKINVEESKDLTGVTFSIIGK